MIILTNCCLHVYLEDDAKIVNDLTKFMSLKQVNSLWTNVSQMSIKPHSMCEIILKLVRNMSDYESLWCA